MKKSLVALLIVFFSSYAYGGVPPSLSDAIFVADYGKKINAIKSVGSSPATFTSTRGANNPATYLDSSGVMQKIETSNVPRYNYGYYNTTGYHAFSQSGVMIEGAATNYLTYSIFSSDAGAGLGTGWTLNEDDSGAATTTLVDVSSTFNVGATVQSQRVQFTFTDGTYCILQQDTGAASFAQNDEVALTVYLKGSSSGVGIKVGFREEDNLGVGGTSHLSADISSSISSTEWRKFTYSAPCADADCDHLEVRVMQIIDINATDTIDIQTANTQCEKLPFASSFVPTTNAALTRNAETLKYETSSNRSASIESCVVKFASAINHDDGQGYTVIDTDTKKRTLFLRSGVQFLVFEPNQTDSTDCEAISTTNPTLNTEYTVGITCQQSSPYSTIYVNGTAENSDVADNYTTPAWGSYSWVGLSNGGSEQLYGTVFKIAFWDRILTAKEMEDLHNYNWEALAFNKGGVTPKMSGSYKSQLNARR